MALYPSQEWCDEWKEAINTNERIAETGKNWGIDFNGNWLFIITPNGGLKQTAHVYLEAKAGKCLNARLLDDPSGVEPGFVVTGSYSDFKPVIKGEEDFMTAVVKGTFKIQGSMVKIMQYARFIRAVANSFSSFESEYLGE